MLVGGSGVVEVVVGEEAAVEGVEEAVAVAGS